MAMQINCNSLIKGVNVLSVTHHKSNDGSIEWDSCVFMQNESVSMDVTVDKNIVQKLKPNAVYDLEIALTSVPNKGFFNVKTKIIGCSPTSANK